jgi:hypothetical protein
MRLYNFSLNNALLEVVNEYRMGILCSVAVAAFDFDLKIE